jgi:hypothetical protein
MTQLPAIRFEFEHGEFAENGGKTDSWVDVFAAAKANARAAAKAYRELPFKNRLMLIDAARHGDTQSLAALRTLILEMMSWREPLPDELVAFSMELIAGKVAPPHRRRRGRP